MDTRSLRERMLRPAWLARPGQGFAHAFAAGRTQGKSHCGAVQRMARVLWVVATPDRQRCKQCEAVLERMLAGEVQP